MAEFALRELIDEKRLQHLQNEFCKVTGVMAVCVDKEGRAITEPYIDKSLIRPDGEDPILGEYRKKAAQALDRVQEGSLEEQVVEELPDGGHVAAVAVSVENQIILYWQVYDLKKLDTISFYQILDLLRDTSADIYRDRMSCFSAEAESRRSRYAEEEMSRNLHTIEATTEIVQLLDSDEQIELTMSRWLKILAQHIQVDSAEIFQLQADTDTMNVVCEWLAPGLISYFDKTSGIPEKSFLHTMKTLEPKRAENKAEKAAVNGSAEAATVSAPSVQIDLSKVKIEPLFADDVDFETFSKSDFRVVKIEACEAVPKSKKLLKFTLNDGTDRKRTILSGIHEYYEPEELVGKTCVAITNLPPRKMMGIDSEGMLISAVYEYDGREGLNLLMLDDSIPAGAKLY